MGRFHVARGYKKLFSSLATLHHSSDNTPYDPIHIPQLTMTTPGDERDVSEKHRRPTSAESSSGRTAGTNAEKSVLRRSQPSLLPVRSSKPSSEIMNRLRLSGHKGFGTTSSPGNKVAPSHEAYSKDDFVDDSKSAGDDTVAELKDKPATSTVEKTHESDGTCDGGPAVCPPISVDNSMSQADFDGLSDTLTSLLGRVKISEDLSETQSRRLADLELLVKMAPISQRKIWDDFHPMKDSIDDATHRLSTLEAAVKEGLKELGKLSEHAQGSTAAVSALGERLDMLERKTTARSATSKIASWFSGCLPSLSSLRLPFRNAAVKSEIAGHW